MNGYAAYGSYGVQQQQQQPQQQQQMAGQYAASQHYDPAQQQQQQQYIQHEQQQQYEQQQYAAPDASQPAEYVNPAEPPVRWSWSSYPTNRLEGARMVVPLGCVYTPLGTQCPEIEGEATTCKHCGAFLNPYVQFTAQGYWVCPLCQKQSAAPLHSAVPRPEVQPGYETVEFVQPAPQRRPPAFVFAVDTCVDTEEELEGLKDYLRQTAELIPDYATVAFISFGTTVEVHELTGQTAYPRSLVLRGTREVDGAGLRALMPDFFRYSAPLRDCRQVLLTLIDALTRDLWPVLRGYRPLRCTGAAVAAAASLLESVAPSTGSCILTFLSGACTTGPGIVVNTSREDMIRGHADIKDDTKTAQHWVQSCSFYDNVMQRIVKQGHSLNVFMASLDQVGLGEMKLCIQASGGVVLAAESWLQQSFRISLRQFFARRPNDALQMGLNATFDVMTSPTWKVQGVIGPCIGTGKKSASVADTEIGYGGTCQWTTCKLDPTSSFAVYFDANSAAPSSTTALARGGGGVRYAQFVTRYESLGEIRTRVTTLTHAQVDHPSIPEQAAAFDQETAAVLLAREAVYKTDSMPIFDVLRWLDRLVVRLVARFGTYTPNQPSTLQLSSQLVFFPAFMYHLRRSGYLQVFNYSPDETAVMRLQLLKSSVLDSIVQIQPTLYSYRLDAAPSAVSLDSTAIQPDNVLLLDTFFEVLIHYGTTIVEWRKAGYAEQEEYAFFSEFLQVILSDAQTIVAERFPTPRLIDVCHGDPDARILYNRINPVRTYNEGQNGAAGGAGAGELMYTDDASLQVFMEQLKKMAVSQ